MTEVEKEIPRAIIRRRTHILVYRPHEREPARYAELERMLTVRDKDASGASWVVFRAILTDTDPLGREVMRLPANVPDDLLQQVWPSHHIADGLQAWRSRPVAVRFHVGQYPYRDQKQAQVCDYLRGAGSYAGFVPGSPRLVVAGTAAGKSYCAIRCWTERSDVLLATFAQNTHLENFRTELLKFTDLTEGEILVVDDGRASLRKAMKNPDVMASTKAVLVLHRTISKAMQEKIEDGRITGQNEFVDFVQRIGVGTHISDEAHLELQSLVFLGMTLNVDQTIYLSATPERTDWMEDRVLRAQLPHDSALYIRSAPRLEAIQVRYNSRPDPRDVSKSTNQRGFFDIVRFFDYLMRPEKWEAVEEMLTRYVNRSLAEGATSVGVVVAGRLEFLDHVVARLTAAFPDRTVGNFSSRVKAGAARMAELDRDIVVTTEKSFSGSVNPERMTHLLFLAPLSSSVVIEQISGRLRGLDGRPCVFYDMWDAGFPKLVEQAKRRRTTYRKVSTSITETNYEEEREGR